MQKQLDRGGYEGLLFHLLHEVDLKGFDPRKAIRTTALVDQQVESLRGVDAIWYQCLCDGELPGGEPGNLLRGERLLTDRKSTRLNSSHRCISYAVFCLKKKKKQ